MKNLFAILILSSLVLLTACKKDEDDYINFDQVKTDNPLKTKLDSTLHNTLNKYANNKKNIGFSMAVIYKGQYHYYNYGSTNKSSSSLPNQNTIYEIGSISKTITASMIYKWCEEEGISLDAPIENYLPARLKGKLEKDGVKVSFKHVLGQCSGIPRLPNNLSPKPFDPFADYDSTKLFKALENVKLNFKPGSNYEYSNLGFALMGVLLEHNTNKSYAQLSKEWIADQLGMEDTKLSLTETDKIHAAQGHLERGIPVPMWEGGVFEAAGYHKSTSEDMLRYLQSQINAPASELEKIFQSCHAKTFSNSQVDMAYGWHMAKLANHDEDLYWHNGGTEGFSSFCAFSKEKQVAVVLLCNTKLDATTSKGFDLLKELILL